MYFNLEYEAYQPLTPLYVTVKMPSSYTPDDSTPPSLFTANSKPNKSIVLSSSISTSSTITVNTIFASLPDASVTLYVTSNSPALVVTPSTFKNASSPEISSSVYSILPSTLSEILIANGLKISPKISFLVVSPTSFGASLSNTVIVNSAVATLPDESDTVYLIVNSPALLIANPPLLIIEATIVISPSISSTAVTYVVRSTVTSSF